MRLVSLLEDALKNIYSYKTQSILTSLGVMLGCAAIGANVLLSSTAKETAKTLIGPQMNAYLVQLPSSDAQRLTPFMWKRLFCDSDEMNGLAPLTTVSAPVIHKGKAMPAQVIATTSQFFTAQLPDIKMDALNTIERVCWVGADLPANIGEYLFIGGIACRVTNSLSYMMPSALLSFDINRTVYIPHAALSRFSDTLRTDFLWGNTQTGASLYETLSFLDKEFGVLKRHWIDGKSILKSVEDSVNVLRQALFMLGCIALLVGVFNLLNLLLMMTQIRQKELGIRQVLGATSFSITVMLAAEISVIVLTSAVVGAMLSIIISQAICLKMGWPLVLSWHLIGLIPVIWALSLLAVAYPLRKCSRSSIVALIAS